MTTAVPLNRSKVSKAASAVSLARRWMAHRHFPYAVGLLVILLTLPAIGQAWVADDLLHRQLLQSLPLDAVLRGLFVFVHDQPQLQFMDIGRELGTMPWWSVDGLRIAFYRPLAALTHWVDYQLWPDSAALMYLQSILWYAVVCVLGAVFYRRIGGPTWVAGLAAFLFAVDVVHLGAVGWLANRNALVTLVFGLLALIAYDRWRTGVMRSGWLWSLGALVLALLAGEAAISVVAYMAMYALFLDRGSWLRRIAALLPAVLVVIIWRVVYQGLGYTVWGSGFYLDPTGDLLRFAASVLELGPVLLFGQWLGQVPLPYSLLALPIRRAAWVIALAALLLILAAVWPLLRRDRVARFWTAGMLAALLPACSITLVSGRVLLFAGLGAMGLMAQLIAGVVDRAAWVPGTGAWARLTRTVGLVMLGLHAILSPLLMPVQTLAPSGGQATIREVTDIGVRPDASGRTVVLVNPPSPFNLIYLPGQRQVLGQAMPARIRTLAPGYCEVSLTRTADNAALVRPDGGYLPIPGTACPAAEAAPWGHTVYLYQLVGTFFRAQTQPMTTGTVVALSDMRAEVTELTAQGQAQEASIRFDRPLDDPALIWLQWDWRTKRFVPFELPPVGATTVIPGPY